MQSACVGLARCGCDPGAFGWLHDNATPSCTYLRPDWRRLAGFAQGSYCGKLHGPASAQMQIVIIEAKAALL